MRAGSPESRIRTKRPGRRAGLDAGFFRRPASYRSSNSAPPESGGNVGEKRSGTDWREGDEVLQQIIRSARPAFQRFGRQRMRRRRLQIHGRKFQAVVRDNFPAPGFGRTGKTLVFTNKAGTLTARPRPRCTTVWRVSLAAANRGGPGPEDSRERGGALPWGEVQEHLGRSGVELRKPTRASAWSWARLERGIHRGSTEAIYGEWRGSRAWEKIRVFYFFA